ncbi:NB-ARC and TPR domain-containing protein [Penicillium herquei]|nr:NB-ARC and TPR domain-containing protein [Penicillium herquei]
MARPVRFHIDEAEEITGRYKANMPVEHARVLLKTAEIKAMHDDPKDIDDSGNLYSKGLREEAVKLLRSRFPDAEEVDSSKTYDDAIFILWR